MTHEDINLLLEEYLDDTLDVDTTLEIESHLSGCSDCSEYLYLLRVLKEKIILLPNKIEPETDLWLDVFKEINDVKKAAAVTEPIMIRDMGTSKLKVNKKEMRERERVKKSITKVLNKKIRTKKKITTTLVILLLCLTAAVIYFYVNSLSENWEVKAVRGLPLLNNEKVLITADFDEGDILNTSTAGQTEISIPKAGKITASSNTIIKRIPGKYAVEFKKGTISASITSTQEKFKIIIPGANLADHSPGCGFKITSDTGYSLIEELTSWLKITGGGREVYLPSNYNCAVWESSGPGIPYFVNASSPFIDALQSFVFKRGSQTEISLIEANAAEYDVVSLWHLFQTAPEEFRLAIFNLIDKFVPPPTGSSQQELLALNKDMLMLWLKDIEKKY